jgi:hypothetical protein
MKITKSMAIAVRSMRLAFMRSGPLGHSTAYPGMESPDCGTGACGMLQLDVVVPAAVKLWEGPAFLVASVDSKSAEVQRYAEA